MKRKNILIIVIIVLLIVLVFPIQINRLKDGGTVEYKTLLYSFTKYHKLDENISGRHIEGIRIKVFGMEVFNNTKELEKKDEIVVKDKEDNNEKTNSKENFEKSFVGTVLEETTRYMIIKPNEDEEERKSSDKIQINYGTDHTDYLYGIGRKVVIHYTGYIMESYPAQINTDTILIDGYEDFEITVKESNDINKRKILNNKDLDTDKQDFNLYYYGLDEVNVEVDNKKISLEEALKAGKVTLSGIVQKANKDFPHAISYDDGGSIEYHYKDYTIIKVHKIDGNRDVYISKPNMKLNDLKL